MKRWHRVVALLVVTVLINVVTYLVLKANYAARMYPPDGDTLAIPIGTTLLLSIVFSPWLVLIAFFSRFKAVREYFSAGGTHAALVVLGLIVLYVPAIVFAAAGIEYWAIPHHYEIAAAFGISLILLILLLWDDFRTLRSNFAPNTDARQEQPRAG